MVVRTENPIERLERLLDENDRKLNKIRRDLDVLIDILSKADLFNHKPGNGTQLVPKPESEGS